MSGGVLYLAPGGAMDPASHGLAFGPTDCRPTAISENDPDAATLHDILERYAAATNSERARRLLEQWPQSLSEVLRISVPVPVAEAPESERTVTVGAT
jgi:glutamate synthase domain-containing protein 3